MRLLHTSDWHLGRTLHGVDLLEHQRSVLAHIVAVAQQRQVDAIVIAGDVYDRSVPNVEAVQLLDQTLSALVDIAPVVIVPGNHDSATRLGFAAGLMRPGIHIKASLAALESPVVLNDEFGEVAIYGVQFLDPDTFRGPLSDDPDEPLPRSHEAVVAAAMNRVRADLVARPAGTRAVVVAHEFVTGGAESDSERDLRVGSIATVSAAVFTDVHYVALGHLHGPQQPASPDGKVRLQYSGSPLRYSFSEADQQKSVVIVDLDDSGVSALELVEVPQPRGMARLTGDLEQLLADTTHVDDWVSIVVTDAKYPEELHTKIKNHFPHVLELVHRPPQPVGAVAAAGSVVARDPGEILRDFVRHVTGLEPNDLEQSVLLQAYDTALATERSA